jgi:CBS domain-containing membrane protein
LAMHLTRSLHPPGGATALIPVLGGQSIQDLGFQFLLTPLALNVAVMLAAAQLQNRFTGLVPAKLPERAPSDDVPSLERVGIRGEDLRAALAESKVFVDVGESELNDIYQRAAGHAYRREFGAITCATIMSRDLVTVEFGDDLEFAWQLMQARGIKALPVLNRTRRVEGIVTLSDFFRHAQVRRWDTLDKRLKELLRRTTGVTSKKPEVVGQIMSSPVVTVRAEMPFADVAPVLAGRGIHQVPVVDGRDKLLGLITQSDLIAALHRNLAGPGISSKAGSP